MRRRGATHGLSLIEGVVAGSLAVVIGFLLLQLVQSSLAAHRKGQLNRSSQAGARSLLSILVSELRSASVPPLPSPAVTTPIYWPGVWGGEFEGDSLGSFYPRETVGDPEFDQSSNRLLYVRAADNDVSNLDPLAGYALAEMIVPEGRPAALERRLHVLTGSEVLRVGEVRGADGAVRRAWLLNAPILEALTAPVQPDIVFDAGADSRIAIRVSHPRYEPSGDPGRTRNPELFDPGSFRIEVAVAHGARVSTAVSEVWLRNEEWESCRTETTELRIPSVRSSR